MKLLLFLSAATLAAAADGPYILLSSAGAARIKAAVAAREAWAEGPARAIRREAEKAMTQGPWSVTYDRPKGLDLGPHEYYSEATYHWPDPGNPSGKYVRRDGYPYPGRFLGNKNAMGSMSEAVFALGTAAWLFDDARYGKRAAEVLRVWFLDPKTRMDPNLEHAQAIPRENTGRGTGIIDSRSLIRAVQGAQFLERAGYWSGADRDNLRRWFSAYVHWLNASANGLHEKAARNNHGSWWAAQVAAYAVFAGEDEGQKIAWDRYRELVANEIKPDGTAPLEEARTKSLGYSAFNVEAHTVTCRIAQEHGVDLWHFRGKNGVELDTAIRFLLPYVQNPALWKKPQVQPMENDRLYWIALAGMGLNKPEYIEIYKRLEKPLGAWMALVDLFVGAR